MITGETIGGNNTFKAPDGTDETGHVGDGHARITFVNDTVDLPYTGHVGSFTAPVNGLYQLEGWGAAGGFAKKNPESFHNGFTQDEVNNWEDLEGGRGGYSTGYVYLTKGQTVYYAVGGKGDTLIDNDVTTLNWNGGIVNGGFNGGGTATGYVYNNNTKVIWYSGAGGGATHFAINNNLGVLNNYVHNQNDVLLVAGGGAGSASAYNISSEGWGSCGSGGAGGGLEGQTNHDAIFQGYTTVGTKAGGGNQNSGGKSTNYPGYTFAGGDNGSFGTSSIDNNSTSTKAGGGGGWYGGASGSRTGGGGGSSYIGSENLINGQTIAGNTVDYTTTNGTVVTPQNMPTHNGAIVDNGIVGINSNDTEMIGNRGDGYARVTLIPTTSTDFDYTGDVQTFTAPKSGTYLLEAWGAQGACETDANLGGKGGYTSGTIMLNAGETIYVYVGQQPEAKRTVKGESNPGGWNGGGQTYHAWSQSGSGGGGATDFRLVKSTASDGWSGFDSLKTRIMVAAGGGGGSDGGWRYYYQHGLYGEPTSNPVNSSSGLYVTYSVTKGGEGGGLSGTDGHGSYYGTKATQTSGGKQIATDSYGNDNKGQFGKGGGGVYIGGYGCNGGGGGYYGGGASNRQHGGGGGGSSFISGHTGCDAISGSSTESNITHTGRRSRRFNRYRPHRQRLRKDYIPWLIKQKRTETMTCLCSFYCRAITKKNDMWNSFNDISRALQIVRNKVIAVIKELAKRGFIRKLRVLKKDGSYSVTDLKEQMKE